MPSIKNLPASTVTTKVVDVSLPPPPGRSLGFTLPSGVVNTDDGSPVIVRATASEATV